MFFKCPYNNSIVCSTEYRDQELERQMIQAFDNGMRRFIYVVGGNRCTVERDSCAKLVMTNNNTKQR